MSKPMPSVFMGSASSHAGWDLLVLVAAGAVALFCGVGFLGALFVLPFVFLGFTLAAFAAMALAFPVLAVGYYLLLIVLYPFFWHRLDDIE